MKKSQRQETENELRLQRLILDYEVRAASWAAGLPFRWMRAMASVYLTSKARRKYGRWMKSLSIQQTLELIKQVAPPDESRAPRNP